MSNWTIKMQDREILYSDFLGLVKKYGKVWASPSHEQREPIHIDRCAILGWEYDPYKDELFTISTIGTRAVCSKTMPAFKIWNFVPRELESAT